MAKKNPNGIMTKKKKLCSVDINMLKLLKTIWTQVYNHIRKDYTNEQSTVKYYT